MSGREATRRDTSGVTDPLPAPLASPAAYRAAFESGLQRMLADGGLGAFILVLANASFDAATYRRLAPALGAAFAVTELTAVATRLVNTYPADVIAIFAGSATPRPSFAP